MLLPDNVNRSPRHGGRCQRVYDARGQGDAASVHTGERRVSTTTRSGDYSFPLIEVRQYTVTAEAPGFKAQEQRGVKIGGGQMVDNMKVINLPINGRNIVTLAATVPGVGDGNRQGLQFGGESGGFVGGNSPNHPNFG